MSTIAPKKIGIDARLWSETGVGRYIRNLIKELQKIDAVNQYTLFALSKDKEDIKATLQLASENNFSLVTADIPWHALKEQFAFPKILEKEKVDLMHFPYFSVPIWYKGKYVLTIHDLIIDHFPTGKASTKSSLTYFAKRIAYKYIVAKASKNAAKIITVSRATKKEIESHLHTPENKIIVTYEGVDEKINTSSLLKKERANVPENYFLYVGNAYPHKNLETLIQAFQQVQNNNVQLLLVGKEDFFYKRLKEKVGQLGLTDCIFFKHNVSDAQLATLYKNALALVVPSLMEGFGLPLLEAMQQACLVVASDIPVFKEIAHDVPLYFEPTSVNSLTNVLESIAKGEIKNEKQKKDAGKILAKKFSWEKTAKETLAVYQSCLGV